MICDLLGSQIEWVENCMERISMHGPPSVRAHAKCAVCVMSVRDVKCADAREMRGPRFNCADRTECAGRNCMERWVGRTAHAPPAHLPCNAHAMQPWFHSHGRRLWDWSRSGGSYGNNTRVICCPAPGRPESAARGTSPPDNKSRGCCCRNSRPTVINPDHNMTKQRCMKCIYDKICPKSPTNRATSPTCLHCDVTHLSLTTGVVALHIPSWRIERREEHRQARKIVLPVNAGRVICRHQNNSCGIIDHHKHIRYCFLEVAGLSIITINLIDTGAKTPGGTRCPLWRTRLLDAGSCHFTHPAVKGNHYSFAPKILAVML